jgi:hypothetical protein
MVTQVGVEPEPLNDSMFCSGEDLIGQKVVKLSHALFRSASRDWVGCDIR